MGAGVEIKSPRIEARVGSIPSELVSWVAQKDPALATTINSIARGLTGVITYLNSYTLGIIKTLVLLQTDGRKVGELGYHDTNQLVGLSAEYIHAIRFGMGLLSKSANFIVGQNDGSVFVVDATSGAVTATLPSLSSSYGRVLTFKKIDASANAMIIDGDANFDGAGTLSTTTQYGVFRIIGGTSEWHVI